MKYLKSDVWIIALALCLITFLGYQVILKDSCMRVGKDGLEIGACEENE